MTLKQIKESALYVDWTINPNYARCDSLIFWVYRTGLETEGKYLQTWEQKLEFSALTYTPAKGKALLKRKLHSLAREFKRELGDRVITFETKIPELYMDHVHLFKDL